MCFRHTDGINTSISRSSLEIIAGPGDFPLNKLFINLMNSSIIISIRDVAVASSWMCLRFANIDFGSTC